MADRVLEKKKKKLPPKTKFLKQGKWGVYFDCNGPADHEYDNIQSIGCVISGQSGKKCQNWKKCHMTEYIDIALSDLVFMLLLSCSVNAVPWSFTCMQLSVKYWKETYSAIILRKKTHKVAVLTIS